MPYAFTAIDPLPTGLNLSSAGVISGTPTVAVDDDYQIQVSDGTLSAIASVHITAQPYTRPIPISKEVNSYELGIEFGIELLVVDTQPTLLGIDFGIEALPALVPILQGIEFGIETYDLIAAELGIEFGIEGPLESFAFSPAIAALIGRTGLTALRTDPQDDDFVAVPDLGFDFNFYGVNRRGSIFVGSNSYVTADAGSTAYTGIDETSPGLALLVGAADRSWRAVYAGSDRDRTYRIRWEGSIGSGTAGPANVIWEMTFFDDGAIMLVTGATFTDGTNLISDGTGSDFTNYTLSGNNSYVFRPNGSGPTYTVQNGSYS